MNILSNISYLYFKWRVKQSPSPLITAFLMVFKWEEYSDFQKYQFSLKSMSLKACPINDNKYVPLDIQL